MLKKAFKDSVYIFFSSVLLALSNWAILSLITKKMSLLVLGAFTLSIAISNPIYQFLSFQLRPFYVTDRKKKNNFNTFFTLRFYCVLTALMLCFFFSFFIIKDISFSIFFSVFVLYGLDAIIDILNARFHYEENFKHIALSSILRAFANFLGVFIGVLIFNDLFYGVLISCILKLVVLLFFDFNVFLKNFSFPELKFDFFPVLDLLKQALPLGISLLFVSLNVNVSKYFIEFSFGKEVQGVFSTLSYLIVIGNMIIATLGQLLMPRIAVFFYDKEKTKVIKTHLLFLLLSLIVGLILYVFSFFFSYDFLRIFFSAKIADYAYLLPNIMIYALFVYLASATGYSLTSIGVLKKQSLLNAITLFLNLFLNFMFLRSTSLEWIIIFSIISFTVQFLLGNVFFIRRCRVI